MLSITARKTWVLCGALTAVVGVSAAFAQEAAKKKTLDARSVLVAWTNEVSSPTGAPVVAGAAAVATNAAPSPQEAEENSKIDDAYALARHGKLGEALDAFHKILQKDPANKRARFGMGTTYIQKEQYKEALAVLEPMVQEFPTDYFLKNNVAWLYATAKDHAIRDGAKAVAFAQDALLIAPRDFHVWSTLSEGYYVWGKYDKALRAAEEALKLAEQLSSPDENLEEYRHQVEKSQKAVQAMSVIE